MTGLFEDLLNAWTNYIQRGERRKSVTIALAVTATGALVIGTSGIANDGDLRYVKKVADVEQGDRYRERKNQEYVSGDRATRPRVWQVDHDTFMTRPHDADSPKRLVDALAVQYEEAGYQVTRTPPPVVESEAPIIVVDRAPGGELVFTANTPEEADLVRRLVDNVQSRRAKKNVGEYWTGAEKKKPNTKIDGELTVTTSLRRGDKLWRLIRHIEEELGGRDLTLLLGHGLMAASPYGAKQGITGRLGG